MKMILPLFRAGLGGRLGNGRQWMSCIHVDDVAGMALWAAGNGDLLGPLNAVMPRPLTNADFTRDVAHAVHRPAIIPAPGIFLRLFLGRMSSMLLDSSRVRPAVAEQGHYRYAFRDVGGALAEIAR
jgi:NAD dependent epimerase/dehydratase family enzyme